MSDSHLMLASFFVAASLSVAITVSTLLTAVLISQKRHLELERSQARRILAAQEEERSRVARELHDDSLQRIAMIHHELQDASTLVNPEIAQRLRSACSELGDLSTELRSAAHRLHPSVVEKAGLPRALGALAEEFHRAAGLEVHLAVPEAEPVVPSAVGVAAYRIAQEALRNIVKHAGVQQADVALDAAPGTLTLRVSDAGKGLDTAGLGKGCGLGVVAMRQRAEAVGGQLTVTARPGSGTQVTAVFPLVETQ